MPLVSMRLATLTVSPNRQYLGIVRPTTAPTTAPLLIPMLVHPVVSRAQRYSRCSPWIPTTRSVFVYF